MARLGAPLLVTGLVAVAAGACGPDSGTDAWARATARTCASTLARSGLPVPPGVVVPARFRAERDRLLAGRSGFNTVQPYRNVCSKLRDEIARTTTTSTTSTVPTP